MSANRRLRLRCPAPARDPGSAVGEMATVQRDGPYTLTSPSLLSPRDPAARFRLGSQEHLELDPALLAMMTQAIERELDPSRVRPALQRVDLRVPATATAGTPATPTSADPGLTGPPTAARPPAVPRGGGPSVTRAADLSDLGEAILGVPAIDQGIARLRSDATGLITRDWRRLETGEKAAVISTVAVIAGGTLAGVASDPDARRTTLDLLNGRVIPVPEVDWLHLEINTAGNNVMVGLHVDVGALLPKSLGFGPGDPRAIGAPPGQRSIAPGSNPGAGPATADPGLGTRITAQDGHGVPLDAPTRTHLEASLGADLTRVRLHLGTEADGLTRALDADAFTSGPNIFFRAGRYAPDSFEGGRLLAHEAIHTVQQAAGTVAGTLAPGGIRLSHPDDRDEMAARRLSEEAAEKRRQHHIGRIRIERRG